MDLNRRRVATAGGAVVLAVLVVLAAVGPLPLLLGLETRTVAAEPARVDPATAESEGYRLVEAGTETATRSATVLGVGPRVRVENRVATYRRDVEVPVVGEVPAAAFVVVATPQARVLGHPLNPVGRIDGEALLERAEDEYGGFSVDRRVGEGTVPSLGKTATVERFRGSTTVAGLVTVELSLWLVRVRHGGDHVLAVGVAPVFVDGEARRIRALVRGIEHPVNATGDDDAGGGRLPPAAGGRP